MAQRFAHKRFGPAGPADFGGRLVARLWNLHRARDGGRRGRAEFTGGHWRDSECAVSCSEPCRSPSESPIYLRLPLPSQDSLAVTSDIDKAAWNYRPVLGRIQRQRFYLALSLLGSCHVSRLLEVGFGSGVFMPALAAHCDELYGIDIHQKTAAVASMLARQNVIARLMAGSASKTSYKSGYFDTVVAISALEFVKDLGAASREIKRILRPEGELIAVVPGRSAVLDLGLRVLTGADAKKDFEGRRERVVPTLEQHFEVIEARSFPPMAPAALRLYTALKMRPKKSAQLAPVN